MAGERIDRVLQEDSTVMSSLSDNSLELCKKAIKGWDGMYNDLLQQGVSCWMQADIMVMAGHQI